MGLVPAALVWIDALEGQRLESVEFDSDTAEPKPYSLMQVANNYTVYDETADIYRNYSLSMRQDELPGLFDLDQSTMVSITELEPNRFRLKDEVSGETLEVTARESHQYELVSAEKTLSLRLD